MSAQLAQGSGRGRNAGSRGLRLVCAETGGWTLTGPRAPARHFADFDSAVHDARGEPGADTSTIEIWQDGEYICCLPPKAEASAKAPPTGPVLSGLARPANRAAQALMTAASFGFWIALMCLALAASLGWRFLVF